MSTHAQKVAAPRVETERPVQAEIKTTRTITLDLDTAAEWFSGLNDEQQAEFFIKVAEHAKQWPMVSAFSASHQWWLVGRHLATCECATDEARELVRSLAAGTEE